jgi:FkbM family methyltransferase
VNSLEKYTDALSQIGALVTDLSRTVSRVSAKGYPEVKCPGSQGEEDELLATLLPEPFGLYMDIGAGHPVECSNTWQFYRRGWCGILVEPLAECWYALLRQRPRDRLYPVACLDKPGVATLRVSGSVSSLQPDWPIEEEKEQRVVEVESVLSIIEAASPQGYLPIDLLSIDVEGSERAVLEGIPWDRFGFRPKVIVIEFIRYNPEYIGPDVSGEWEHILTANGYVNFGTSTTQTNKIYTRKP